MPARKARLDVEPLDAGPLRSVEEFTVFSRAHQYERGSGCRLLGRKIRAVLGDRCPPSYRRVSAESEHDDRLRMNLNYVQPIGRPRLELELRRGSPVHHAGGPRLNVSR